LKYPEKLDFYEYAQEFSRLSRKISKFSTRVDVSEINK
jgi:hypothetical protein